MALTRAKLAQPMGHKARRTTKARRHTCAFCQMAQVLRRVPCALSMPRQQQSAAAAGLRLLASVHLLLGRSVLPRVSPALAAAEGHQSTGPSHPAWRVGRKVGKAPSSQMRAGRLSQGGQWPMCARLVPRLLWCAPLSERGAVQHRSSKSWQ